jgi:hypothetical protein
MEWPTVVSSHMYVVFVEKLFPVLLVIYLLYC